mmetsp:Transcript_39831/g.94484  ORF Transcript_39831/g.94484 Transcript_39831/m.94484 type:complete len:84 (-) Transcript_39831:1153-1404(-)
MTSLCVYTNKTLLELQAEPCEPPATLAAGSRVAEPNRRSRGERRPGTALLASQSVFAPSDLGVTWMTLKSFGVRPSFDSSSDT